MREPRCIGTLLPMKTNRRKFLTKTALGAGVIGLLPAVAAEKALTAKPAGFLIREPAMKLGTVTYNLAQDWDIETIIRNCEATKFQGVELRTTHAHKVEVNLGKEERERVFKIMNGRQQLKILYGPSENSPTLPAVVLLCVANTPQPILGSVFWRLPSP